MNKLIKSLFLSSLLGTAYAETPNVVIIYADDLGYGDIGINGATLINTPNIDRLAAEGRNFTDAHSASAVCTPSRYGLLTGNYPFREGLNRPIAPGSGIVFDPDTKTVADLMKDAGYNTSLIGKWHLGFGRNQTRGKGSPKWNFKLGAGPLECGFDYYFGVPVVNSAPPYVYVENRHVVGLDPDDPFVFNKRANTETQADWGGQNRGGKVQLDHYGGAKAAHLLYRDREVGTKLTEVAKDWLTDNHEDPFFMIYASTAIHHPFTPATQFEGTSDAGIYGDFVHELDWIVGEITQHLEDLGVADNTMIILTSDNGGMANNVGQYTIKNFGHKLNGDFLGFKFGAWEGGHRVPFIVKWPGQVPANTVSDALISSVDLFKTFAVMLGSDLEPADGRDSLNVLSTFTSNNEDSPRTEVLYSPSTNSHISIRRGDWVYIPAKSDGGFSTNVPWSIRSGNINSDFDLSTLRIANNAPATQLYNLATDPFQRTNIVANHPNIVTELQALRKSYLNSSRTTEFTTLENSPNIIEIGVDYSNGGKTPGSGVEPGWVIVNSNGVASGATNLISGQQATGISIQTTGIVGEMGNSALGFGASNLGNYAGTPFSDLSVNDGVWSQGAAQITFSGLNDDLFYDLDIVALGALTSSITDFTVSASGSSVTATYANIRSNLEGSSPALNPVKLEGLTTDGNGNLTISLSDNQSIPLNALYLTGRVDYTIFDFESGDLQGATVTAGNFGDPISDREFFVTSPNTPYNNEGDFYLSTLEGENETRSDSFTGTITSNVFKLTNPNVSLLIGGGRNTQLTYFALNLENGTEIFRVSNSINAERMERVEVFLGDFIGKNVYWEVVDNSTSGWGHITVDDIRFNTVPDVEFRSQDIGAVSAKGSLTTDGLTYQIQASGSNIWRSMDEFHFASTTHTGDGEIIATVNSIQNTHPKAKAGIMLRKSSDANSANVAIMMRPDGKFIMQARPTTGATTQNLLGSGVQLSGGNGPTWFRLTRKGDNITGYWSRNGQNWNRIATIALPMGQNILSGIAASSNNDGTLGTSEFSNVFQFSE